MINGIVQRTGIDSMDQIASFYVVRKDNKYDEFVVDIANRWIILMFISHSKGRM